MSRGQNWRQPLLSFKRLRAELDAEDRACCAVPVLAVATTPATDHPVVPHEVRKTLDALVAPTNQEIFKVEGAGHGALRQDARP